jgi:hypothetical protein
MNEVLLSISKQLQQQRLQMMEDLADGKAKKHSVYQYHCGVMRGLLIANNILAETAERLAKQND